MGGFSGITGPSSPFGGLMSGGLLGMLKNLGGGGQPQQGQPAQIPPPGAIPGAAGTPAGLASIGPAPGVPLPPKPQIPGPAGPPQLV